MQQDSLQKQPPPKRCKANFKKHIQRPIKNYINHPRGGSLACKLERLVHIIITLANVVHNTWPNITNPGWWSTVFTVEILILVKEKSKPNNKQDAFSSNPTSRRDAGGTGGVRRPAIGTTTTNIVGEPWPHPVIRDAPPNKWATSRFSCTVAAL